MTRLGLGLVLLSACTAAQSARVLAPGKTAVTVGLDHTTATEGGDSESAWFGEVMVRHGLGPKFDGGIRLGRIPGASETLSSLSLDPKVQVTEPGAKSTLAFGVPVGLVWQEQNGEFDLGLYTLSPTLYFGQELSPTAELVLAPKVSIFIPQEDGDTKAHFGGAVGVRFTDPARTWALHPELGLMRYDEGNDGLTILTLGLSISAGN